MVENWEGIVLSFCLMMVSVLEIVLVDRFNLLVILKWDLFIVIVINILNLCFVNLVVMFILVLRSWLVKFIVRLCLIYFCFFVMILIVEINILGELFLLMYFIVLVCMVWCNMMLFLNILKKIIFKFGCCFKKILVKIRLFLFERFMFRIKILMLLLVNKWWVCVLFLVLKIW